MDHDAQAAYLQTEVLTATPQRLRLMLIEGALRFASQARQHWADGRNLLADVALGRCRAIVAELLASVRNDSSEVARQVRGLHGFLLRTLIEAGRTRDAGKLSDVIRILQVERETWQEVCRQLPEPPGGHRFGRLAEVTQASATAASPGSALPPIDGRGDPAHGSLCLDA